MFERADVSSDELLLLSTEDVLVMTLVGEVEVGGDGMAAARTTLSRRS